MHLSWGELVARSSKLWGMHVWYVKHVCMYECMHACMHASMYVEYMIYVCVCMCICMYRYIYICIYLHTHTYSGLVTEVIPFWGSSMSVQMYMMDADTFIYTLAQVQTILAVSTYPEFRLRSSSSQSI